MLGLYDNVYIQERVASVPGEVWVRLEPDPTKTIFMSKIKTQTRNTTSQALIGCNLLLGQFGWF